jgi:hypothetical protein
MVVEGAEAMNRISDEIERLKLEARMLLITGDWRGLSAVLDSLNWLFRLDPSTGLAFYREMAAWDRGRRQWQMTTNRSSSN